MQKARTVRGKDFSGKQYHKGSEVFKDKLALLPKQKLAPDAVVEQFERLLAHVAAKPAELQGKSVMQIAQTLAPRFPVCAYGYPKTYIMALAGKLTMAKIRELCNAPVTASR